jgi:hypothetical protein
MRKRDGGAAIETCIIDEPFITIIYIVKLDKTGWYYKLPLLRGTPAVHCTRKLCGKKLDLTT